MHVTSAPTPRVADGYCPGPARSRMCAEQPLPLGLPRAHLHAIVWCSKELPGSFCPTAFLLCALFLCQLFESFEFLILCNSATLRDENSTAASWDVPLKLSSETGNITGYTLWQHSDCSSVIHYICHLPSANRGNYVITKKNFILIIIQSEDASIM